MGYLGDEVIDESRFPALVAICKSYGFVPNFFRAQTSRPDLITSEARLFDAILTGPGALTRTQKELIFLVCSAANLSTYCVTAHCEVLKALGVSGPQAERVALDHRSAGLCREDEALLDFAAKLNGASQGFGQSDVDALRSHGFNDQMVLEAVLTVGLARFANLVAEGLGTASNFDTSRTDAILHEISRRAPANLSGPPDRQTTRGELGVPERSPVRDPDAGLVARVRAGDADAFEELVRRHEARVYRTLLGIIGNTADAEDGAQRAFMKAFERISSFEGASTFATWLTRIAINEGLERLRSRKVYEPLEEASDDPRCAPKQIRAWGDSPEDAYAKAELKAIVERELLKLPARYRAAVLLRDIQELSSQEAAEALGLGVPTLKTHLLRGRLMLREALTPYFPARTAGVRHV